MTRRNLFVAPYFDDYFRDGGARENNYYRILYRPGFAVQARELTQSQTILQDQIRGFGNHIFRDGSLVAGGGFHPEEGIDYVRIQSETEDSETIDLSDIGDDLVGRTIEGAQSGIQARVIDWYQENSERVLYVTYTRNGGVGGTITSIADDERILITDYADDFRALATDATGKGLRFTIDPGIIYMRGFFVNFDEMSIIVDPLNNDTSWQVGFVVDENFISSEDDDELLDIATGSPNFAAPGAHRLQVQVALAVVDYGVDTNDDFFKLLEFFEGTAVHKRDTPQYSEIRKEWAKRTYDLNGHVAPEPFNVTIREHLQFDGNNGVFTDAEGGDHEQLVARVSPGRAYVAGFEVKNDITQNVAFDKAVDTEQLTDQSLTISLGNYVQVNEMAGDWCLSCVTISLRDTAAGAITNGTYSSTSTPGSEIGTAKIYAVRYASGTPSAADAEYQLYIFDVQMTSGQFSDVRSLVLNEGQSDASFADVVLNASGDAELVDSNLRSLVFPLPQANIQQLRDGSGNVNTTFEYSANFDVSFSSGSTTISISEANEQFPFGVGTLSTPEANTIRVIADGGEIHEVTNAEQTSDTDITLDIADTGVTDATVVIRVQRTSAQEARKAIRRSRYVKIDYDTAPNTERFELGFSDIFRIVRVTRGSDYDLTNEDVTNWFRLDNGQRDAFYRHGRAVLRSGFSLSAGDKLVFEIDYFETDFSQGLGYYSIDSYPVDDSTDDPQFIKTWEIPSFTTRAENKYNLSDVVDFRNILENTSTDATDLANASINPSENDTFLTPPGGIRNVTPTRLFTTDFAFYIPYYAVLSATKEGDFEITRSSPSENPSAPSAPKKNMILATIRVNPYPSLAPRYAKSINKEEFSIESRVITHKIYTDSDVGNIEKRVGNLEEEVALNTLEREASNRSYLDENNIERFKNGFLTDQFKDHRVGDFTADGYNCAISSKNHKLSPSFSYQFVDMTLDNTTNTNRDS